MGGHSRICIENEVHFPSPLSQYPKWCYHIGHMIMQFFLHFPVQEQIFDLSRQFPNVLVLVPFLIVLKKLFSSPFQPSNPSCEFEVKCNKLFLKDKWYQSELISRNQTPASSKSVTFLQHILGIQMINRAKICRFLDKPVKPCGQRKRDISYSLNPFDLKERLPLCPKGQEHWVAFQTLCKDILSYLFVPPLDKPIVESKTETGHQRRDIIFPIPYDAKGFWAMVRSKYHAEALIVDCKNYSRPIRQNEIIHISRYLGKRRLGLFAIIISRLSPAESAIKEIKRLWRGEEEKLILCLCDDDLKKMIKFKEDGQEPEKVIDKIRFDTLASLE